MADIPPIEPYPMPNADDLPVNTAQWTVDPHRAVLLIHDMQRYFVRPFPADESPGKPLVDNIVELRAKCTHLGVPVAYTAQPGAMTEEQRGLLKDFWGRGMRAAPGDRLVIDRLAPGATDWNFTKWRYSAFFGSELLQRLNEHGRDQLVLCGVYAHVGVLMTAVDSFTHDIQPFLVADATADFTPEFHRLALDFAAQRCAVVDTTWSVLGQLDRAAIAPAR